MKGKLKIVWIVLCITMITGFSSNFVLFASERPLHSTWTWPITIDPAIGSDMASTVALLNLYDPFVYSDNKGEPQSHIAKSWAASDNGLVWTFEIRQGIKFHDGTVLTASDVKFSFDRFINIGRGLSYLFLGQNISTKIINDYTIEFYLEKPMGPFLNTLMFFYIVNEDLVKANTKNTGEYGELGDYGKEYLLKHDAGSGPYMIKDISTESSINMKVNNNYWIPMDLNVPDEFVMIGTTEPITVRTLLSQRQLEIADQYQSEENLKSYERIEGIAIGEYPYSGQWTVQLHTRKAPTDCIHFRKAMSWAFDYSTAVNKILPNYIQARGPIPQNLSSHNPSVFQYYRNLEEAREELKKSRYYEQLENYPIELHWCAEVPDEEKVALLLMSNLAEIGIKVEVVKSPWMVIANLLSSQEVAPNAVISIPGSNYSEAGSLLELRYASKSAGNLSNNEWLYDKEYDYKLEDALQTIDREERYNKYNELQHYIVDLCPTIFIADQKFRHPYQEFYVDWYVDKPFSPVKGYHFVVRNIKIYPEKRELLLK